jgi:hypothetical protein
LSQEAINYLNSIPENELFLKYPFYVLKEEMSFASFGSEGSSTLEDAYEYFITNAYMICKNPVPEALMADQQD